MKYILSESRRHTVFDISENFLFVFKLEVVRELRQLFLYFFLFVFVVYFTFTIFFIVQANSVSQYRIIRNRF